MNRLLAARAGVSVRASGWTFATVAFAVAVVVLLVGYWQTIQSLLWVWTHDGTYQYAYLIFPLSCWAAFNLRDQLRAHPPRPSVWGWAAVAVLVIIWYAGRRFDVNLPQHFALVALFPALVLTCWGWRALWVLVFPLGYLVFAVPWGDALVGPLQDITAHIAVRALNLTGTPVLMNGREIVTSSAVWMVADACSGVKFFIACTALGCLYSYLMYRRWWKRVLFVVLAAIVPVVANGLRVYFTILIGDTFGLKYATGLDHMIFGWQFFGTVLLLLLLVGWLFRDRLPARESLPRATGKLSGARMAIWLPALLLLIAGPVLAARRATPQPAEQSLALAAPSLAGWIGPLAHRGSWHPSFIGAAAEILASYRARTGDDSVELFHAVYLGSSRRGHDLISYGNDVYNPAEARVLSTASPSLKFADGSRVNATELRLAGVDGARLVWYWYCIAQRCTRSPVLAKLFQAWDAFGGGVPRSAVWALSTPVFNADLERARANLRAFARVLPLATESHRGSARPQAAESGP
ncbi:MAG: exosortase A [Gammaproteobacteria bacterium]